MKKILIILMVVFLMFFVLNSDCEPQNTAESDQQKKTEQLLTEVNNQIGMPDIKNFQEKKLAKMIFELRDQEDLICFAYIVNLNGKLIFLGKCLGFGLPYSVQYTNPSKIVDQIKGLHLGEDEYVLPQADPNGLYMPQGLSATWIMLIDKEGQARPVYIEPQIIVSPFKLH